MSNITLTNAKGEDVSKAAGKHGNGPQAMSKPDPKKQPPVIPPPKNEAPPGITAPPKDEKAEEKVPTPEELDEQRRQFSEKMFGSSPKREKKEKAPEPNAEKPAETKPPEAAAKPEEKKEDPKPEPKSEPKAKAKVEEDDEHPARAKAEPEAPQPNVKGKPTMERKESTAVEGLTLTKGQELLLKDLKELERTMPDHYRDIAKKQTDFWKLREQYVKDWEKAHPDEDFNPKSEEHSRFYDKHEPEIDPDDLEVARRTLMTNEAEERAVKRMSSSQTVEQVKREMKEASPRIRQEARKNMFDMVKQAAPEVFEALKADAKAAQDTYELELEILNEAGEVVQEVVFEMQYLLEFGDHYQPDVAKRTKLPSGRVIYPHAELLDFAKELQEDIAAMPSDQTERDGKKFMPSGEFYERLKSIHEADMEPNRKAAADRDLRAKYWVIDREGIRKAFVQHQAEIAGKRIEKIKKLSDKRNGKTPKSEELKVEDKKDEDAQTTDEHEPKGKKHTAPASLSGFDKSNASTIGTAKGAESSKAFRQKMGW